MKLRIKAPEDRDAVVVILARNGYTVRQGRAKLAPEDKTASAFVEIVEKTDRTEGRNG